MTWIYRVLYSLRRNQISLPLCIAFDVNVLTHLENCVLPDDKGNDEVKAGIKKWKVVMRADGMGGIKTRD